MRTTGVSAVLLATALLFGAGCAVDDSADGDDIAQDDDAVVTTAARPTVSIGKRTYCEGLIVHVDGHVTSSVSNPTLTFKISGGSHPIPLHGGEFSFNPGGSGTLIAKACNAAGCTEDKESVNWIDCHGDNDPGDPR
jgi:hypothetical protein